MTPYLLILAVLLGIAPGLIAHGKGRNFLLWWLYGVFLGPIALLHAILLRQKPTPYYATESYDTVTRTAPRERQARWRYYWPMALWGAASVAIAIVAVAAYGILSPDRFTVPSQERPGQERDVSIAADRSPAADSRPDTTPTARGGVADTPAAEQPRIGDETPTVRVRVRQNTLAAPPERVARAPAMPVERISPEGRPVDAQSLERTKPRSVTPATPPPAAKAPAEAESADPDKARDSSPSIVASLPAMPETKTPAKSAAPDTAGANTSAAAAVPTKAPPAKPVKRATETATKVTAVGETVQIVQLTLAKKGYDPGPANGRAGSKTQTAIRKFQADRGLRPTGAIDYDLLEKLGIVGPRVHAFRPPPGATPGR